MTTVRLPGTPDRKAELLQLATEAAAIAGMPAPDQRKRQGALFHDIQSALAVAAEALANQEDEIARLRARRAESAAEAPPDAARAALTLADLRERLRAVTSPTPGATDGDDPGQLRWIIDRLDEALHQLGVMEYHDRGRADPTRNQVIGRCPADSDHPDGTIASSVRPGLLLHGRVLRPQQVIVYVKEPEPHDG